MSLSNDQIMERIELIEALLLTVQNSLNNVATKRELRNLMGLLDFDVNELQALITDLQNEEDGSAIAAHLVDYAAHVTENDTHVTAYDAHIVDYNTHVAEYEVHAGIFNASTITIAGEVIASGMDLSGGNLSDVNQVLASGNMTSQGKTIRFPNLPTSDPNIDGALWSDSGTIKISSG